MSNLVHVGDFCPNAKCTDYRKLQTDHQQNIIKFGHTQVGRQRYRCQTPMEKILQVLAHIAEGNRISSLTRTTGHKEDTILEWLKEAAEHVEAVENVLMTDYQITRGQLDGLWAYVGNKGEKKAMPKPKRLASSGARP